MVLGSFAPSTFGDLPQQISENLLISFFHCGEMLNFASGI